jgi:hypothetical protein
MSQPTSLRVLSIILLVAAALPLPAQQPAAPPDATLYTTYSGTYAEISWLVCGSTQESEGCYSSGSLGPFVSIGAMLEGTPTVSGDVVTRAIYIVDSGANPVKLYVYTKTDTVTASDDTVSVTLTKTLTLPLTGGSNVAASMAANRNYLFIGTDEGTASAVKVLKSTLHVTKLDNFSAATLSITSDQYGYITVAQVGGFTVYGPDGQLEEDGGGSQFMIGTSQALPASAIFSPPGHASLLGHKPKSAIKSDSN